MRHISLSYSRVEHKKMETEAALPIIRKSMKASLRLSALALSISIFASHAGYDLGNQANNTKLALHATAIGALDIKGDLPAATTALLQEISTNVKKPISKLSEADIKKGINGISSFKMDSLYKNLQSEDKYITLEGIGKMYYEEKNENELKYEHDLKTFVNLILYVILTGNSLNDELRALVNNDQAQEHIKHLQNLKLSTLDKARCAALPGIYVKRFKEDLLSRYEEVKKQCSETLINEIINIFDQRKKRYMKGEDLPKSELEKLEKKASDIFIKRLLRNQ